ncbi:MAG: hypothetical protein K2X55_02340 [Burkholderiaceae bacterium]|nr:hypothetical protein [Burkholderiaceae bacterium]
MLGNGIKQTTSTTGTGSLTVAAVTGYPTLAAAFAVGQPFAYALLDATGLFLEAGIGYLSDATTLVRARVSATFLGGVYSISAPTAVSLTGTTTVICTPHAATLESMLPTVDGVSGIGRWLYPANRTMNTATVSLTGLRCLYTSYLFRSGARVSQLMCNVTVQGGAGAVIRLGIYSIRADGYIGDLLATTGDLAADSTGMKIGPLAAPLPLPPGWYYVAIVSSANATQPVVTAWASALASVLGGGPLGFAAGGVTPIEYRHETLASAVLPASASTTTTAVTVGTAHVPAIYLGAA